MPQIDLLIVPIFMLILLISFAHRLTGKTGLLVERTASLIQRNETF